MRSGQDVLIAGAVAHGVLAAVCAAALLIDVRTLLGLHPAVKPLKFAVSITLLLGTMALIVPMLGVDARLRSAFAWLLTATMLIETAAIVVQAARGQTSHFNVQTAFDRAVWSTMMLAIVLATVTLVGIALAATVRAMHATPLLATAVRIGLWLVLLVAVSGFAMGGRMQHSVGGADGGAGLPVTGWSRTHGDLRVSHFFALHGLQALPLGALALQQLPGGPVVRWVAFLATAGIWTAVCVVTLVQAFGGRPLLPR